VKTFFVIMLMASVASVFYELGAGLHVGAHNHYEARRRLLETSDRQPDPQSASLGLTQADLSQCNNYIAEAYKESVNDGYRLGAGYEQLSLQSLALAALLFLTSIMGIRTVAKVRNCADRATD
jgi:hypothetical protein